MRPDDVEAAMRALRIRPPRPVLVVIGGADAMSEADTKIVRSALDRGVLPAAAAERGVILTGGTASGVIAQIGQLAADRPELDLVGVAPATQVRRPGQPVQDADPRTPLDTNHHKFVLTPGEGWGSETESMVALASAIASSKLRGVVLLANGGAVARLEAQRFLASGWPVITLAGTGRAADDLAAAVRARRSPRWRPEAVRLWGDVSGVDVEVHTVGPAGDGDELLVRRLRWRLTSRGLLRAAWSRQAAFDVAAGREKSKTTLLQSVLLLLGLGLAAASVVFGISSIPDPSHLTWLKQVLVVLPVVLAVVSTVGETVVPSRNWRILREGAESVLSAIYRFRAGAKHADQKELARVLSEVDTRVLESGVPLGLVPQSGGRPSTLSASIDEFSDLALGQYLNERVAGQLRYYHRQARRSRRWELAMVGGTTALAVAATAVATAGSFAAWVPVLVLAASVLVIVQQRARWRERITLSGRTIAALDAIRRRALRTDPTSPPADVGVIVDSVEDVLEREHAEWAITLRSSQNDARDYALPLVDRA